MCILLISTHILQIYKLYMYIAIFISIFIAIIIKLLFITIPIILI